MFSADKIKDIQSKVYTAVQLFLNNDSSLLDIGAHEQAIAHRIAVYLEPLFKKYNIDCEYNKHLEDVKRIDLDLTEINYGCSHCKRTPNKKRDHFRPDIIVHVRKQDSGNLIALELKTAEECLYDLQKLKALTDPEKSYKYRLGLFV